MKEPFLPPPKQLQALLTPLAERWNLPTLPLHAHQILLAFTAYHVIMTRVSPVLSAKIFPKTYPALSKKSQLNWDVHVVSLVQSIFISGLALWVMFNDEERKTSDRIYGYTSAGGAVQGFAAGYFLWDLVLSVMHFDIFGPGFTAHAISALAVYILGFVSSNPPEIERFLTIHRGHLSTTMRQSSSSLNSPTHSSISTGRSRPPDQTE